MDWQTPFKSSIVLFRRGKHEDALRLLNDAIEIMPSEKKLYDSRAAVFEKLDRERDALNDAKRFIDLAPESWQGYARSARLFLKIGKTDATIKMADLALERLNDVDEARRTEIANVKQQALDRQEACRRHVSKTTYHFGKLAVEIASTIFLMIAEDDLEKAIQLSHVCRHWRNVAINTPDLWRSLKLSERTNTKKVTALMQRSRGIMKDLHIRGGNPSGLRSDVLQGAHKCFWERLQCLTIGFPSVRCLPNILSSTNVRKLRLQSLTFEDEDGGVGRNVFDACQWKLFNDLAPESIRSLTIACFDFPWPLTWPLRSLTQLVLRKTGCNAEHVFDLLESNPGLERLVIDLSDLLSTDPEALETRKFALSRLTSLEFAVFVPAVSINLFFRQISFPNLHSLVIRNLHIQHTRVSEPDAIIDHLTALPRSSLIEVRFVRCCFSQASLIRLLKCTTELTTLELSHYCGSELGMDDMMDTLAGRNHQTPNVYSNPLCPNLQHVDLSSNTKLRGGSLVHLVKSRLTAAGLDSSETDYPTPNQIQSLVVDSCPMIDPEVLPWLRHQVKHVSCVYMTKKQAKKTR